MPSLIKFSPSWLEHPAHHYRIHLWDDAKPIRALAFAARCGQTAPGIAHLWHMPGTPFPSCAGSMTRPGSEASARVDHGHLNRTFVLPDQIHNYAHNQEWLVRTYNELGRVPEALALASNLISIPQHPDFNTLNKTDATAGFGGNPALGDDGEVGALGRSCRHHGFPMGRAGIASFPRSDPASRRRCRRVRPRPTGTNCGSLALVWRNSRKRILRRLTTKKRTNRARWIPPSSNCVPFNRCSGNQPGCAGLAG